MSDPAKRSPPAPSAADALSLVPTVMSSRTSVIVGLNAAFQKRFVLPPSTPLIPGSVHRAERVEVGVGGKGQDVAVSLSCLWRADGGGGGGGEAAMPLALAQFVGAGGEGDAVMGILDGALGEAGGEGGGWASLTVRPGSGLRTCTTIVGSDRSTELVEPSGVIEPGEMEELLSRMKSPSEGGGGGAGALCVMGSMPPGCPDETYANIYDRVAGDSTVCLIDSVAGLGPLISAVAARRRKSGDAFGGGAIFKVNAAELCRLAGVERGGGGEAEGATEEEVDASVDGFLAKFTDAAEALDYLAITDGRHTAHLVHLDGGGGKFDTRRLGVVDLLSDDETGGEERLLYPIGAGDTVAAGTLAAWLHLRNVHDSLHGGAADALSERRRDLLAGSDDGGGGIADVGASFEFGLACGSASCLQRENSVFEVEDALRLFAKAAEMNR